MSIVILCSNVNGSSCEQFRKARLYICGVAHLLHTELLLHLMADVQWLRLLAVCSRVSCGFYTQTNHAPPKKSTTSSVSSLPMRISRWIFVWGIAGICGFCPTRQPLATNRAFQTRTHLGDDLPFHKQPHRCMQAICIPLHVELKVVLRLFPLSNASATPMVTSKWGCGTFSSRCWNPLFELCSAASVRGAYRRVSCTPWAFAVDLRSAFGASVAGTSRY